MGLTPTGIALARALGRRGVEVIGVSSDDNPPAAHSRLFCYRRGPRTRDKDESRAFYLALGDELGRRPVVLPTGDPNVLFLSAFREELAQRFRFLIPAAHELEQIASKRSFAGLARDLDLPLPRTEIPHDRAELERLAPSLRFPCVLKPEYTTLWRSPAARAAGLAETKAVPATDLEALLMEYDRLAPIDDRLIVQEMVRGPDENHFEYHAMIGPDGTLRAEFAGRKLRLAPPHYGMGSYVESVDIREVQQVGRLIFDRLGYRGMGHLDLKRDERDGELYLFELNPRFSVWTGLAIACGIDFPYYYYLSCIGENYDFTNSYPAGKRWLDFSSDKKSMRTYSQEGTWTRPRWVWSLARASVWALFAPDDPGPSWVSFRRWLRHDVLKA
jgi:predicted ATP-grasp superfamily ATP-dependent carboligase